MSPGIRDDTHADEDQKNRQTEFSPGQGGRIEGWREDGGKETEESRRGRRRRQDGERGGGGDCGRSGYFTRCLALACGSGTRSHACPSLTGRSYGQGCIAH